MIEINNKNIKLWSMLGTRATFGAVLTELVPEFDNIMAITADFTKSSGLNKLKEQYPAHFLSVGIAEQNMIGISSGLASEGKNVFACSFASFITTRCYEQIKVNLGYMRHNVKIVGIASGLGVSYQGNTHYGIDDVSLMRLIPGMKVIVPADSTEVVKATIALAHYEGPAYLRLVGEGLTPIVNTEDYEFVIGKAIIKREGEDIAIVASGTMVNQALKVAKVLAESGIEACVINMHTIKPLDCDVIDSQCLNKKLIVTIEEGTIIGGLGGAVAEYLSEKTEKSELLKIGVDDQFPHPGSYPYLLEQCGLSVERIVDKIQNKLK